MNSKSSVIGNASWIIGGRIIQSLLGLIISMLTARYLGPSNYGIINYAASIVAFFTPIALLGLDSILVQEIVDNTYDEGIILGTSVGTSFLISLVCILAEIILNFFLFPNDKVTIIVCSLYGIILIFQAIELIQYWFQAKLMSKYASISMLIAYLAVSIYKIILLISEGSIYLFALSNVLNSAITSVLLIFFFKDLLGRS